ncbi:GGDEF domain-containing protein [Marinobacterium sp. D7]|uniref:diguanylate cyclase n=1 Tax=Marinobacterium ramblicola TaxID=2849041 RepID=UPI001C2DAC2D|nr:diguanylate cyclase [Marinobacterium ramblicola]MBV1789426.1 GGDEF domain-containing protein [Marinobacterium ramblicola]
MSIDIDKFKLYNDHYGHLQGDDCLRRVAEALRQSVRLGDLVARYGGEEVAMVLPGADSRIAEQVAERARAAVEALAIPHERVPGGVVTVSIGVATMVPNARMQPDALLAVADEALYRAKSEGRNGVRVALG